MANYNIRGMVPDVVSSVVGGLQAAKGMKYFEDRKRRIAQQEADQERQQTADFGLMAQNLDLENPQQVKQAAAYLVDKYPKMKDDVVSAYKQGPDGFKNLISMFQPKNKEAGKDELDQELKIKASDFKNAKDLRAEIYKETGEFQKITNAYDRISVSGTDPTAAGDLSLIFNYMKMLDPNSVVRESEFATAANAAGVPDRVRNTFNRILSGERLAKNQRKDFITQADKLYKSANRRNDQTLGFYRGYADRIGIPVEDIIVKRGEPSKTESKKEIKTQEEYDKLPSGAVFIEDGQEYRKP